MVVFPYDAVVAAAKTIKEIKGENDMAKNAKFNIGDIVYNKVRTDCPSYTRHEINGVRRCPDGSFEYMCDEDKYTFKEKELTTKASKFDIGDVVYNKVERWGSYEPSVCHPYTRLKIDEVKRRANGDFEYICTIDGYTFKENELMSEKKYKKLQQKNESSKDK